MMIENCIVEEYRLFNASNADDVAKRYKELANTGYSIELQYSAANTTGSVLLLATKEKAKANGKKKPTTKSADDVIDNG